jgi:probable F420-dependent oxidoreductase
MTEPLLSIGLRNFASDAPNGWSWMLDQAVLVEAAGFDRVNISDHVVFGERLDAYGHPEVGGTADGVQPTGPDGHWLEPLTTLAVIAGRTSRIRLGTNILLAALRRPAVLAKTAATLDVLSGGRLDLGVGVGWQREEYEAVGLEFADRGRLLDHTLEVCQTLWREQRATYASEELRFDAIHQMPKPLQPGGVPLWISGTVNARVARRVARFAAGWIPWGPDADDVVGGIARMRAALDGLGFDHANLRVVGRLAGVIDADRRVDIDKTMAVVPQLVAAGVTDFQAGVPIARDPAVAGDELGAYVAAFRTTVG